MGMTVEGVWLCIVIVLLVVLVWTCNKIDDDLRE